MKEALPLACLKQNVVSIFEVFSGITEGVLSPACGYEWITEMDAIYIVITTVAVSFAIIDINSDPNKAVPSFKEARFTWFMVKDGKVFWDFVDIMEVYQSLVFLSVILVYIQNNWASSWRMQRENKQVLSLYVWVLAYLYVFIDYFEFFKIKYLFVINQCNAPKINYVRSFKCWQWRPLVFCWTLYICMTHAHNAQRRCGGGQQPLDHHDGTATGNLISYRKKIWYSLTKCYVIIPRCHVKLFKLYLSWTTIKSIITQNQWSTGA